MSTTEAPSKPGTFDNLLRERLLTFVQTHADGNGVKTSEVHETGANYYDIKVQVLLKAQSSWKVNHNYYTGKRLQNTVLYNTVGDAKAACENVVKQLCEAPRTISDIQALVTKNPDDALQTLGRQNSFVCVATTPDTNSAVVNCDNCSGHGKIRCTAYGCHSGKVTCEQCNGDGKRRCSRCHGTGQTSKVVYGRNYDGSTYSQTVHEICFDCNGRGRHSLCFLCHGSGNTSCTTCRGTARVDCRPCDATGCFTHLYAGQAGAVISVTSSVDDEKAPTEFGLQLANFDPRSLPSLHAASYSRAVMERIGPLLSGLKFTCIIPYRLASLAIGKDHTSNFAMIGKSATITIKPTFLDKFLTPTAEYAENKSSGPHAVIRKLQETRVGKLLLEKIADSGLRDKRNALRDSIVEAFAGTISPALSERLAQGALKSYHGVGKRSSKKVWQMAIVPILLFSLWVDLRAAPDIQVNMRMPFSQQLHLTPIDELTGWLLVMVPVVLAAVYAGHKGRQAVRAATGNTKAKKAPKQGGWPFFVVLLIIALRVAMDPLDLYDLTHLGILPLPWQPAYLHQGGMLYPYLSSVGLAH